jgi:hypothetical protein
MAKKKNEWKFDKHSFLIGLGVMAIYASLLELLNTCR